MTTLEALRRLQWKFVSSPYYEGDECPSCYQRPPEHYKRGHKTRYKTAKKKFGHLPGCWIGKAVAQAEFEEKARQRGRQMSGGYCADRECKDRIQRAESTLEAIGNLLGGPTMSYAPQVEHRELKERVSKASAMIVETICLKAKKRKEK